MDPIGFSMENFDAVGAHRTIDAGNDRRQRRPARWHALCGLPGLRNILLARKGQFTQAFTEKLMTYALGRGVIAATGPRSAPSPAWQRPTISASAPSFAASSCLMPSVCAKHRPAQRR
jgi:hypothetical protein